MYKRDASMVATYAPDDSDKRYLGAHGDVAGLTYSYALPGGPDQMSLDLMCEPGPRLRALEPGRIVAVERGASRVWDGKLDMPVPNPTGWHVNAHGAGQFGGDFMAYYPSTFTADAPVDQAISRGMRWINPGILAGGAATYLAQVPDPATSTVTDHLNGITGLAGTTWYVGRGNRLTVFTPPTAVTHLLITTLPAARTLLGYFTEMWLRYQSAADNTVSGAAAVMSTTSVTNAAQAAKHGQMEIYADLSAAGTLTAGAAQAVGTAAMAQYQSTSFADPFDVAPGQLRTLGGTALDLGVGMPTPMVCQLLVANNSYGGEVAPTPPLTFLAGGYTFTDDTGGAQLTPYQYAATDLAGILSTWVTLNTPAPAAA